MIGSHELLEEMVCTYHEEKQESEILQKIKKGVSKIMLQIISAILFTTIKIIM